MLASDLIKRLQALIDQHGDRPVAYRDYSYDTHDMIVQASLEKRLPHTKNQAAQKIFGLSSI